MAHLKLGPGVSAFDHGTGQIFITIDPAVQVELDRLRKTLATIRGALLMAEDGTDFMLWLGELLEVKV